MTALDVCAIAVVAISLLFAYARGVIRSLIGTAAWVVGFVAALAFTPAGYIHSPMAAYFIG